MGHPQTHTQAAAQRHQVLLEAQRWPRGLEGQEDFRRVWITLGISFLPRQGDGIADKGAGLYTP